MFKRITGIAILAGFIPAGIALSGVFDALDFYNWVYESIGNNRYLIKEESATPAGESYATNAWFTFEDTNALNGITVSNLWYTKSIVPSTGSLYGTNGVSIEASRPQVITAGKNYVSYDGAGDYTDLYPYCMDTGTANSFSNFTVFITCKLYADTGSIMSMQYNNDQWWTFTAWSETSVEWYTAASASQWDLSQTCDAGKTNVWVLQLKFDGTPEAKLWCNYVSQTDSSVNKTIAFISPNIRRLGKFATSATMAMEVYDVMIIPKYITAESVTNEVTKARTRVGI